MRPFVQYPVSYILVVITNTTIGIWSTFVFNSDGYPPSGFHHFVMHHIPSPTYRTSMAWIRYGVWNIILQGHGR